MPGSLALDPLADWLASMESVTGRCPGVVYASKSRFWIPDRRFGSTVARISGTSLGIPGKAPAETDASIIPPRRT